jgi:streptogramin lyase
MKIFILLLYLTFASASVMFNHGDIFAGVGNNIIKRFNPQGGLEQELTYFLDPNTADMQFDDDSNLYAVKPDISYVLKLRYDTNGTILQENFINSRYIAYAQSLVIDNKGIFYVGGISSLNIEQFNPDGTHIKTFTSPGSNFASYMDLDSDQCTLFYTSQYTNIVARINACSDTKLPDFAILPTSPGGSVKITKNGNIIVATFANIYKYSKDGILLKTYNFPCAPTCYLFSVNLDPDLSTFWTADWKFGYIYRVDIETGNIIKSFNVVPLSEYFLGVTIYGEFRAAHKRIDIAFQENLSNLSIGSIVTINISLVNFIELDNVPLTIYIKSSDGLIIDSIITDSFGRATYSYMGTSLGEDHIFVNSSIHSNIISNYLSINWHQGEIVNICSKGETKCINTTNYKICIQDNNGNTFWKLTKPCCSGFSCQQKNNNAVCAYNSRCNFGDIKCTQFGSYQLCDKVINNTSFWGTEKSCCSGFTCLEDSNGIYCGLSLDNSCVYNSR